jgi:capping protein alpha
VKAIAKIEAQYQSSLDTSYSTMGDTTFKALRRALPIFKGKIDWAKIRNYQVSNAMSNK